MIKPTASEGEQYIHGHAAPQLHLWQASDADIRKGMTRRENPQPADEPFKTMRMALQMGSNFWNAGELYGTPERNSLHLFNEYFEKYHENADKIHLSMKGSTVPGTMALGGSEANINRSIDECLKVRRTRKWWTSSRLLAWI